MNDFRVIVYNVDLPEMEKAIQLATKEYQRKYNANPRTLTVQPDRKESAQKIIDVLDLQLIIDGFNASPSTIQVGE